MKIWMQKTFALALVAAMLCGCVVGVSAAGSIGAGDGPSSFGSMTPAEPSAAPGEEAYYNRIDADVTPIEGFGLEFQTVAGTAAPKVLDTVGEETKYVYKDVVKLKLTLDAPVEEQQYVVMLLNGENNTIPTKDNIRYIDQDDVATFTIYPDQMSQQGEYNVVVSSVDGKVTAATFEVLEPLYVLGDVDGDGDVTSNDAGKVLRAVAKLDTLSSTQEMAADADGDGDVTSNDAGKILRVVAKLDSFSKT